MNTFQVPKGIQYRLPSIQSKVPSLQVLILKWINSTFIKTLNFEKQREALIFLKQEKSKLELDMLSQNTHRGIYFQHYTKEVMEMTHELRCEIDTFYDIILEGCGEDAEEIFQDKVVCGSFTRNTFYIRLSNLPKGVFYNILTNFNRLGFIESQGEGSEIHFNIFKETNKSIPSYVKEFFRIIDKNNLNSSEYLSDEKEHAFQDPKGKKEIIEELGFIFFYEMYNDGNKHYDPKEVFDKLLLIDEALPKLYVDYWLENSNLVKEW